MNYSLVKPVQLIFAYLHRVDEPLNDFEVAVTLRSLILIWQSGGLRVILGYVLRVQSIRKIIAY